ncbi:hypothetical protein Cgig2_022984 [Carnegiea gigantea]|uniref:Uncharacterized protein n=1 Tax=Carnegiea gigantea TaxID=171969 RepID=A0A9Q1JUD2_9CARY|nr:hypothetical protein Cgig2_022984 [Carnegiea gigantea]
MGNRENGVELLQRCRRDRRVLLKFVLSGGLIKNLVLPSGAVSLDDVDLDQVSVDYVLNCVEKGEIVDLSEAIKDYHDDSIKDYHDDSNFPIGSTTNFSLVTNPGTSGSPPRRAPPPVPGVAISPVLSCLSKSDLSVDDIEDFEDEDDMEQADRQRMPRRTPNEFRPCASITTFCNRQVPLMMASEKLLMRSF